MSRTGCLFVMLISSNNFQLMEGYNCTTETIENTLRATCRGDGKKHESGLPKGLSQEIQVCYFDNTKRNPGVKRNTYSYKRR